MTEKPCPLAPRHDPDSQGICRWCHAQVAEPWFMRRRPEPAQIVLEVARRAGSGVSYAAAVAIADELLGYADCMYQVTEAIPRFAWEDQQYRVRILAGLRSQLLDKITSEGRIPTALPSQAIRYFGDRTFGLKQIHRNEIPAEAVARGVDFEEVEITLAVQCRTPPIDRAAAVRAGVL